jgi:hypothetical protein
MKALRLCQRTNGLGDMARILRVIHGRDARATRRMARPTLRYLRLGMGAGDCP